MSEDHDETFVPSSPAPGSSPAFPQLVLPTSIYFPRSNDCLNAAAAKKRKFEADGAASPQPRSPHTPRPSAVRAKKQLAVDFAEGGLLDSQYTSQQWAEAQLAGGDDGRDEMGAGSDAKEVQAQPGSGVDWVHWMSEEQIRMAYGDLRAMVDDLESAVDKLKAENCSLTRQLRVANKELRQMKLFMVVAVGNWQR